MKKISLILSLCLVIISISAQAGDNKNKKEQRASENSRDAFKIKTLLLAKEYNSQKIEGTYIILYTVDANQQINITQINGENEEIKRDIFNHLQGKKLSSASANDVRKIKVLFNNH
jgi:hypothetical protein